MRTGVDTSCHFTMRFGVCLAERNCLPGLLIPQEKRITRQKSSRSAATLGSNSTSMDQSTKVSKACPPLDVIYSTLFLVLFHTAEDSKDKSDQWAGRTEVSVLFKIKSCLSFGVNSKRGLISTTNLSKHSMQRILKGKRNLGELFCLLKD